MLVAASEESTLVHAHKKLRSFRSGSVALQTLEATNADSKSGQVKVRTPRYENYHFGRFLGTMSGDLTHGLRLDRTADGCVLAQ